MKDDKVIDFIIEEEDVDEERKYDEYVNDDGSEEVYIEEEDIDEERKYDEYVNDGSEEVYIEEEVIIDEPYNDIILEDGEVYGAVEDFEEQLLTFSIEGLYKDKDLTKVKSRGELMIKSPYLTIKSSNGYFANFPLTYNFNQMMLKALNEVNYAYLGIRKTSKRKKNEDSISTTLYKNKMLILQLFIGITLGLFISNGSTIPAIITSLIGIIVVFHDKIFSLFSDNESDDIDNEEIDEVEVDINE